MKGPENEPFLILRHDKERHDVHVEGARELLGGDDLQEQVEHGDVVERCTSRPNLERGLSGRMRPSPKPHTACGRHFRPEMPIGAS